MTLNIPTYSQIDTDKALRSYKFNGHRQAAALAALQREILKAANQIKVTKVLDAKYGDTYGSHKHMRSTSSAAL